MKNRDTGIVLFFLSFSFFSACNRYPSPPPITNLPGEEKTTTTQLLGTAASSLQNFKPIRQIDLYLDAFHPMKDNFAHQMEAHHYCHQLNEDFSQCIIYDGNTEEAHMVGIEYIISQTLYKSLPEKEKSYWHPHNYEILSGQLIAPGLPEQAEKEVLKIKMNSYGKTWHIWNTYSNKDNLPLGEPELAWSFTRKGQIDPNLVLNRDERFGISTTEKSKKREGLKKYAAPQ